MPAMPTPAARPRRAPGVAVILGLALSLILGWTSPRGALLSGWPLLPSRAAPARGRGRGRLTRLGAEVDAATKDGRKKTRLGAEVDAIMAVATEGEAPKKRKAYLSPKGPKQNRAPAERTLKPNKTKGTRKPWVPYWFNVTDRHITATATSPILSLGGAIKARMAEDGECTIKYDLGAEPVNRALKAVYHANRYLDQDDDQVERFMVHPEVYNDRKEATRMRFLVVRTIPMTATSPMAEALKANKGSPVGGLAGALKENILNAGETTIICGLGAQAVHVAARAIHVANKFLKKEGRQEEFLLVQPDLQDTDEKIRMVLNIWSMEPGDGGGDEAREIVDEDIRESKSYIDAITA